MLKMLSFSPMRRATAVSLADIDADITLMLPPLRDAAAAAMIRQRYMAPLIRFCHYYAAATRYCQICHYAACRADAALIRH